MKPLYDHYDAVVIGGGFYGCSLAIFLRELFPRVVLVERESQLLTRASLVNQARVHSGYHYPRSFLTALRSHVNFPRFVSDYRECIDTSFDKYYAIARNHSKVSALQFRRVCENIGIPIRSAPQAVSRLFSTDLIEEVFCAQEYAFDAVALRHMMGRRMADAGVEVALDCSVSKLVPVAEDRVGIALHHGNSIEADRVYNCTYAGINTLLHDSGLPLLPMKNEVAEIVLIEPPDEVLGLAVTVLDGPFFSTMPYPARSLYSLSHVRYTPHSSWRDDVAYQSPGSRLRGGDIRSNYPYMVRDARRYLPCLVRSRYVDSLFEIKTVLVKNEVDDGRPILFRQNHGMMNLSIVMGGKIDNIYDILHMLSSIECAAANSTGGAHR